MISTGLLDGILGSYGGSWEVLGSPRKSWEVIGSHGEVLGAAINRFEVLIPFETFHSKSMASTGASVDAGNLRCSAALVTARAAPPAIGGCASSYCNVAGCREAFWTS